MASAVDVDFPALAERMAGRADELADGVMERMGDDIPAWARADPELWRAMREFTRESILAELTAFRRDGTVPERCPDVDAEGARQGAAVGTPLDTLLTGYRNGHFVQWEAWLELVEESERPAEVRRALLERGSRFFFAYADRLSRFVTDVYTRERERSLRDAEQRRVHLIRELLDGGEADESALGYPVAGAHHLGLVTWGADAADAVRDLAARLDRRLLLVNVVDETWWAWLGGGTELGERGTRRLARFRVPRDARVAVGAEAPGADGFRRTPRQAVAAAGLAAAVAGGARLTRYDDVALEALALGDEAEARDFVARELRGLDGGDVRSRRLRETLAAYFGCGHNAAAAAAALGVHEQTVAHRIRAVEERTGRPVATRRAELEVALRLRRVLADGGDGAAAPG